MKLDYNGLPHHRLGGIPMTEREQREALFRERLPKFTDYEALKLINEHGQIVSVDGRHAALDLFIIAFASDKGTTVGPLSLNPIVARALCKLLIDDGHGPEYMHQT
jgi:hypothetical protein